MKKIFKYALLILVLGIVIVGFIYYPRLNLITGFAAKNTCSCAFISERSAETIAAEDNGFDPVSLANSEINSEEKSATSKVFGLKKRKAVYKEGIGCTLLPEETERVERKAILPKRKRSNSMLAFPYGNGAAKDSVFPGVDNKGMENALDFAFAPENETRAVVILYKGHLLTERYSKGISKETKLAGWSMTKSITNAVLGVLHKQGIISLEQDHLFEEWKNDERAKITIGDLLHMNSGLEWDEDYEKISDVTKMLFLADNMGEVQLNKPLVGVPGESWNYSSGTTNLLSNFIGQQFKTHQEYLDFWYDAVIDRIGMNSMTIETDLEGNYVGSSYAWATARDWSKFGLLFLNKGNWNGEQILEESWVKYSATPTNGADGTYGAHFWLNAGGVYPDVPKDLFSANGFQGQYVFVIPSRDLVVVRLGLKEAPEFDVNKFLSEVTNAIK